MMPCPHRDTAFRRLEEMALDEHDEQLQAILRRFKRQFHIPAERGPIAKHKERKHHANHH